MSYKVVSQEPDEGKLEDATTELKPERVKNPIMREELIPSRGNAKKGNQTKKLGHKIKHGDDHSVKLKKVVDPFEVESTSKKPVFKFEDSSNSSKESSNRLNSKGKVVTGEILERKLKKE